MLFKLKKSKQILILFFLISLLFIYHNLSIKEYPPVPMSLSVSSNGKYVIAAHTNKLLSLWDLENKTSQLISNNANIYSAYFIPGTNQYIWQEVKNNTVHVENIKGKTIKKFNPGFSSYGQLISKNLHNYLASDEIWNVYKIERKNKKLIKNDFSKTHHGKNINLSWVKNYILTSGACGYRGEKTEISKGLSAKDIIPDMLDRLNFSLMRCIVLWNYKTGKALFKLNGNSIKTYATLSPDAKYVASGDENGLGYVWETKTGKKIVEQYSLLYGKFIHMPNEDDDHFERKNVIHQPKDFCSKYLNSPGECHYENNTFAVKFINNEQYLRFITGVPYAILYDVLNPNHKKYLKLGGEPSIFGYNEAGSISTAPNENLLVMASNITEGIRVYKFDKKNERLKLVWAPDEIQRTFKQKAQRLWKKLKDGVLSDFPSDDQQFT